MNRQFCLVIALTLSLSLVLALGVSSLMKTTTAAPAPTEKTPFKRNFVFVNLKSKQSVFLENAQIRKLGDSYYVVGVGREVWDRTSYCDANQVWTPMSEVETIIEFETKEQFKGIWDKDEKKVKAKP